MSTDLNKHGHKQNIVGFVPAIVMEYLIDKIKSKEKRKIPDKQSFNSVVMFADISGFTNLAERLSKKGNEGAELLAFTLNRYMELLVKAIGKSGGDIFKFAGDAMIVLWPPPQNNNFEELTTLLRQAIQSGLDIQSKLHNTKMVEDVTLSVKIGFGVGQVTILHVGGVFNRVEYLAAGDPLTQAFQSEHLATAGGVVIVSRQVWDMVNSYFEFEEIKDTGSHSDNGPFYYVKNVKKDQSVKMKADALLIKNKLKPSDIEAIKPYLASYIPAAILPYIMLDQEKWCSELRRLSILFINLGIDLSDAKTEEGLYRIQLVIETVQNSIYMHEGSVNKLLMDDKGSTLIVVFGLPPISHQDDPVRAVLSALTLTKELKKINCLCSIGITTGVVMAGVVGTSGSRREYSVLGDSVNLSARFMQAACYQKEKKILVDDVTKKEAECKICFKFVMKQEVKGKSGEISFYEPIDPSNYEVCQYPLSLKTHFHTPNIGSMINAGSLVMIGAEREKQLHKAVEFSKKNMRQPIKPAGVFVTGTFGIGKGLFVRNLIEQIRETNEALNWKRNESIHVFIGFLNSRNKSLSMNAWRPIIPDILHILSMRVKKSREDLFDNVFEATQKLLNINISDSMCFFLKELCHIESMDEVYPNMKGEDQDLSNKISKYFTVELIRSFLEEKYEESPEYIDKPQSVPPCIIVFDDFQDYDEISLKIISRCARKLKKILLIFLYREDFWELPLKININDPSASKRSLTNIESKQKDLIIEQIYKIENSLDVNKLMKVYLSNIEKGDIKKLLSSFYKVSYIDNEECVIIEEDNHKDVIRPKSKTAIKITGRKSPEDLFHDFLMEKTYGNPLDIISLTNNLIEDKYITVDSSNHTLILLLAFLKCKEYDEYLTIAAPVLKVKQNGPILDHLDCIHYLVLKGASVIGSTFDYQTLLIVNPLKDIIQKEKIKNILSDLCQNEILEILDDHEYNITFRFVHEFMRECLYQRLIYSQRRQIHRLVAEAIQSPVSSISIGNPDLESKKLIYHWCLAENIEIFSQSENDNSAAFSSKAKRSIIVKQISSMLTKHSNITLKTGTLFKKSDKGLRWSPRFCLLNTKDFRYYYSEEDYKANPDFSLGTVSLKNVFSIQSLDPKISKKSNSFVIYTGGWQKKSRDMGIRQFYFAAQNIDDLDTWSTYLEFLRAKAVYDDFVNTFGKISFPLKPQFEKSENIDRIDQNHIRSSNHKRIATGLFNDITSGRNFLNSKGLSTFGINRSSEKSNTLILNSNSTFEPKSSRFLSTGNSDANKNLISKFLMASKAVFFSHSIDSLDKISTKSRHDRYLGMNTQFLIETPSVGLSLKTLIPQEKAQSILLDLSSAKKGDDSNIRRSKILSLEKIEEIPDNRISDINVKAKLFGENPENSNKKFSFHKKSATLIQINKPESNERRESSPFNDYPKPKFLRDSFVSEKPKSSFRLESKIQEESVSNPVKELISRESYLSSTDRNHYNEDFLKKLDISQISSKSTRKQIFSKKQEFYIPNSQINHNLDILDIPKKKITEFELSKSNYNMPSYSSVPMKSPHYLNASDFKNSEATVNRSTVLQSYPQIGVAAKDTRSIDGDIIMIPKGATVTITRAYEKQGFFECLYENSIGLFPTNDILLIHDNNKSTSKFLMKKMKKDMESSFQTLR